MDEAICTDDDCPDHSAAADHCTTAIKVTSAMSRMHVVMARHHMHFGCGAAARRPSFSSTARMGRQRSGKRRRATSAGFGPLRPTTFPPPEGRGGQQRTRVDVSFVMSCMHARTPPVNLHLCTVLLACFSLGNRPLPSTGTDYGVCLCSLTRNREVGNVIAFDDGMMGCVCCVPPAARRGEERKKERKRERKQASANSEQRDYDERRREKARRRQATLCRGRGGRKAGQAGLLQRRSLRHTCR